MAELRERNQREVVEQEEVSTLDSHKESMPAEWTNEKHSLYLNSMEAMFVKQLYNHEYNASDSLGWTSRRKNQLNSNSSEQSKTKAQTPGQFKVPQGRKKLNFVGVDQRLDTGNLSNSCAVHREYINRGKHSKISLTAQSDDLCDNSVFSYKEVTDQNFVDDEPVQKSHVSRKKRMKEKVGKGISNDQVVPSAKSPATVGPNRRLLERTNPQSGNVDGSMSLEAACRYYKDQETKERPIYAESLKF